MHPTPCSDSDSSRRLVLRGWLIFFASLVHLTWGITLMFSPEPMKVAPVSHVAMWFDFNQWQTSAVYTTSALLAWWGAIRHKYDVYALIVGIPQMVILFMGMSACIEIIVEGVHPDGTISSTAFFFAQLANSIWLPPVYMVAIYGPYWRALWKTRS